MALVTVTNHTSSALYLSDFYTTLAPAGGENSSRTFTRAPAQLTVASALQSLVAAGKVSVSVELSATELASGLAQGPDTVDATDTQEVVAAAPLAVPVLVRAEFMAGAGGSPDDVPVIAAGELPYKFRVVQVWALIGTPVAASTLQLRTQPGGVGTALGQVGAASAGYQAMDATNTASALAVPSASEGLFVRRSDNGVAGEVFALIRRET